MKKNKIENLFLNKDLLDQALTHKSWINENKGVRESNERLEFLGDAVLELVVSEAIFHKFIKKEEGYLSALRANLVNTKNLAAVAKKLDIGELIHLSKGEESGGARKNSSLLADTVEAIIGALYIDKGFKASEKFICDYILVDIPDIVSQSLKDPKSMLQEYVQNRGERPPRYAVVRSFGPDHAKIFTVQVKSNDTILAKATGPSKAEASQKAAKKALLRLSRK